MNKEDYNKFYIQGSDHYLIPRDVFDELFNEMMNWKEGSKGLNQKYLNAVADYESVMFEKEQLNSLVNSCQEEIRQLKKQVEEYKDNYNCLLKQKEQFEYIMSKQVDYQGQRKAFINYLEDKIKSYKSRDSYMVADILESYDLNNIELELVEEILQKYKEIIGGKE